MDYSADIDYILSKSQDNGADFWATPEGSLIKGGPFSTLEAAYNLATLGLPASHPMLTGAITLVWQTQRKDGRFSIIPKSGIYPCQTIHAARTLCALGFAGDSRLQPTLDHLLQTQYRDGGWRCNKFFFGRGPETEFSNPGPTLSALDIFRQTPYAYTDERLDHAVEFLLSHWTTRAPLGPCHYGIGTLFHQVSFPFLNYNLFNMSMYSRFTTRRSVILAFWMRWVSCKISSRTGKSLSSARTQSLRNSTSAKKAKSASWRQSVITRSWQILVARDLFPPKAGVC